MMTMMQCWRWRRDPTRYGRYTYLPGLACREGIDAVGRRRGRRSLSRRKDGKNRTYSPPVATPISSTALASTITTTTTVPIRSSPSNAHAPMLCFSAGAPLAIASRSVHGPRAANDFCDLLYRSRQATPTSWFAGSRMRDPACRTNASFARCAPSCRPTPHRHRHWSTPARCG